MPRPRQLFTSNQLSEIQAAYKEAQDTKVKARLHALSMYGQGVPVSKIVERTGVTAHSITKLYQRYHDNGLTVIESPSAFTPIQITELRTAIQFSTNIQDQLRLTAILLYAQGASQQEITNKTGYVRKSVIAYASQYRKSGLAGVVHSDTKSFFHYRKNYSPAEISQVKAFLNFEHNPCSRRRLQALLLKMEGKPHAGIARETGLSSSTISIIIKKYANEGIYGVNKKRREYTPDKYIFSANQERELRQALQRMSKQNSQYDIKHLLALWLRAQGFNYTEISTITNIQPTLCEMSASISKMGYQLYSKRVKKKL